MCIWVSGWVGWGVLEGYEWIERGEEELHHYMVFVTLKENSSLVRQETIVPIT